MAAEKLGLRYQTTKTVVRSCARVWLPSRGDGGQSVGRGRVTAVQVPAAGGTSRASALPFVFVCRAAGAEQLWITWSVS